MAAVKAAVKYEMRCGVAMDDSTLMYKEMRCGVAMNDMQIMNAAVELVTLHQSEIIHRDFAPHFIIYINLEPSIATSRLIS